MKGKRKAINKIMREFSFRECVDVMTKADITWTKEGIEYIPSIDELKSKAESMLKSCADSGTSYCKVSGKNLLARKSAPSLELFFFIDHKWG